MRFVAAEDFEGAVFLVRVAEGEGDDAGAGERGPGFEVFLCAGIGFVVEHIGIEGDGALEAEFGEGEFSDECALGGGFGFEFGGPDVDEVLEFAGVLFGEDDVGGESMFEGVAGGALFAFFGFGSTGFGPVDAGLFGAGELRFIGGRVICCCRVLCEFPVIEVGLRRH